jgi:hypothetical protein
MGPTWTMHFHAPVVYEAWQSGHCWLRTTYSMMIACS